MERNVIRRGVSFYLGFLILIALMSYMNWGMADMACGSIPSRQGLQCKGLRPVGERHVQDDGAQSGAEGCEAQSLCVTKSSIAGNQKIGGNLDVGGTLEIKRSCSCLACQKAHNGVSGAFQPGILLLHGLIDLSADVVLPAQAPFEALELEQGCIPLFDNPFNDARAVVVTGRDLRILKTGISGVKGVVLERGNRTNCAVEFTLTIGYPCFAEPPLIIPQYQDRRQGTLLNGTTGLTRCTFGQFVVPLMITSLNIFPRVSLVQRGSATVKILYYFEISQELIFESDACFQSLLTQIKELINATTISLRIFGLETKCSRTAQHEHKEREEEL